MGFRRSCPDLNRERTNNVDSDESSFDEEDVEKPIENVRDDLQKTGSLRVKLDQIIGSQEHEEGNRPAKMVRAPFTPLVVEKEVVPLEVADARAPLESIDDESQYSENSYDSGDLKESKPN